MVFFNYLFFSLIYGGRTLLLILLRPRYWSGVWKWRKSLFSIKKIDFEDRLLRLSGRYKNDDLNPLSTPLSIAFTMLEEAQVDSRSVVVDLGAGRGAFLMAALFHDALLGYGIEAQGHLVLPLQKNCESLKQLKWIHADVRDVLLPEGTHYILAWTTWATECRKVLENKLNSLPVGVRIWVWTHELSDARWTLIRHKKLSLPGYRLEVFLYEKG